MTPEELAFLKKICEDNKKLSEENSVIQKMLMELRLMIERFTTERTQNWKDEAVKRRERCW